MDDASLDELLSDLCALGAVRSRRMFGGAGLYCDDVFFGLVAGGVLYFKVDEQNAEPYRAAGAEPFRPFPERDTKSRDYFEVPSAVRERPRELVRWARAAVEAGRRRDATKRRGVAGAKRARTADAGARPVRSLQNVGPKSAAWLAAVGVRTRADLERTGAVHAYRAVVASGVRPTRNLLYALEGALLDLRHDRLPDAVKRNLLERLARAEKDDAGRGTGPRRPRPRP